MKYLIIAILLASCSAEQRIKEHSYTEEWYYDGPQRYQVYKTRCGERYVLVLNNRQTKFVRKYIR